MNDDMIGIIEPLIPAMRRYARALMRNKESADDLVQDCLERAIDRWHQRQSDKSARAWLFTILHNLAITRLQRVQGQPPLLELDEAISSSYAAAQENNLFYKDVMAAIDQLTDEHKTLLLLVAVEGFSYSEVAQMQQIPLGTVMSRLSRARAQLHKILSAPESQLENRPKMPLKDDTHSHLRRIK
ncbi:RNA polymerase sigma factor (plasmid) [Bartonella sp. HY329]|uniref:RNA polymerase sigma factor n=1 Tax=unclassified Bartonella TaxID=2645622 RepID=UPI0021C779AB|nr:MULTISPECIES: RNA polymerase sigma factor [unclassified Bartonella]UXM96515.1 RNA polymerase sigma factor [Bartonella sp. HY329]UXN10838.1 RNA polymerase sigma factor [Bartonella sp. HY328]